MNLLKPGNIIYSTAPEDRIRNRGTAVTKMATYADTIQTVLLDFERLTSPGLLNTKTGKEAQMKNPL